MKALFICENLIKAIANKEIVQGRIHSVFKNACNIETGSKFITLLNTGKGMAPMSLIVANGEEIDFKKLNLSKNSTFNFSEKGICCSEENIFISFECVQKWFPGIRSNFSDFLEKDVLENIKAMETGLNTYEKLFGLNPFVGMLNEELPELELSALRIYSQDKNFEFIRYRLLNFIQALLKNDIEIVAQAAESIIGFGPGLTPAADDFISGIMISFIYCGKYYKLDFPQIYKFNQKLISKGLEKTTRVSSEMLKQSSVGETNQVVRELMESIFNQHNEGSVIDALVKTVEIGETSGSDIAQGIYIGCKIRYYQKKNGQWHFKKTELSSFT